MNVSPEIFVGASLIGLCVWLTRDYPDTDRKVVGASFLLWVGGALMIFAGFASI